MLQAEIQFGEDVGETSLPTEKIQSWLESCFSETDDLSVVIRFVNPEESQSLNRDYRGKDKPTNVLSFPFEVPPGVPCEHLGDLVICVPVLEQEAGEQGKSVSDHLVHLIVHGVLHLQGYDHIEDTDAEEMEALEVRLLQRISVANPYHQAE